MPFSQFSINIPSSETTCSWGLLFLCISLIGCKASDLRTPEVIAQIEEEKGKQLMDEVAEAHYISVWQQVETYSFRLKDDYFGIIGKLGNPYPQNQADLQLAFIPGTFTGKGIFQKGKWKDKIWGIQAWSTYTRQKEGTLLFHEKNEKNIEFWLPTYQYFIELPARIQETNVVSYAGQRNWNQQTYELVYATWNQSAPQKEIDQYLLWINVKTKQIELVEYTVRDANKWIRSHIVYQDYRNVKGLLIPHKMTVSVGPPQADKAPMHIMILSDFQMDPFPRSELLPDPKKIPTGKPD